ncbi:hypothetical protein DES36_10784 [Alkalibaculum bacchi]|uniref:Reverse transcriptase (RNA-dependent DNA polymerase) n=1 Tax=Alkalibaculum bacchi TaxID=645887 RepID=A0A366I9X7_9FIRM|nr:hypothetical protein [Alkalibaculum bacchi]RBP65344.1 hypothetical protein DES36_10784 [Alkalibaculum bacchi]
MNVTKTNNTIDKVRQLQRKLYQSAKRNRVRKFHALYDKLYRKDILYRGWQQVKCNKGSAGVDKQTIEDIESYGIDKVILEIQEELKEGQYNPAPVRRVYIPKAGGKKRPLGIPTVKESKWFDILCNGTMDMQEGKTERTKQSERNPKECNFISRYRSRNKKIKSKDCRLA